MNAQSTFHSQLPGTGVITAANGEQVGIKGRLKIYLGYAAGTGTTYSMLQAAVRLRGEGVDVVAACVETHASPETESFLERLEIVPCQLVEHRAQLIPELDVDAVLKRKPRIVLIDNLSHNNAPGLRHPRRYQDVQELLESGIDVHTTLNIQHLESLNDIVWQIVGVQVEETIPDQVFDSAAEVELVDLPPNELQARLEDGRLYLSDGTSKATRKLYRTGNLNALRQLALRRTAEWVDKQMRSYMQQRFIPGPWPAGDHILVCVSHDPHSERLVRSGQRLASELNARWTALNVQVPQQSGLAERDKDRLAHALQLAEVMGGQALTLSGRTVAETVIATARQLNVTRIILGQSKGGRWRRMLCGSIVEQILQSAGALDVLIIGMEPTSDQGQPTSWVSRSVPVDWRQFGLAVLLVLAGSLLSGVLQSLLAPTNLVMIYLLSVVLAALYLGRGPAVLTAVLSVLVFDFFFVPPYLTLAVSQVEYLFTFVAFLVVGLLISDLTARVQKQLEDSRRREKEKTSLLLLSSDLAAAVDLESVVQAASLNISHSLGRQIEIMLPGAEGNLFRGIDSSGISPAFDQEEMKVATWAFEHNQPAGGGTDTFPEAGLSCLPLKTTRGRIGVLAARPVEDDRTLTPDQHRLLEAFASLTALAIERVRLADELGQMQLFEKAEKLQSALLNSISHDLRTPLVSITGALSTLQEKDVNLDEEVREVLIDTAAEEASRLNRLVGNLLEMTRLEAGAVHVRSELRDLQDVIGAALQQTGGRVGKRPIVIEIPPDLPLVPLDFSLLVQVLVNLIDNAIKFSPTGSPIEIRTIASNRQVTLEISDRGTGIPPAELEHVFEKFYRAQLHDSVQGTGLGLSISRGLVEAQGGQIAAANRPGGGTTITINLPLPDVQEQGAVKVLEK